MIFEDMIHGAPARSRARRRIEHVTPVVPRAVAEGVWEEACVWLDEALPPAWIQRLEVRANVTFTRNARFRQTIRRGGDAGRDWLWAFMRHWLAAMIRRRDPRLYARLPAEYSAGRELPEPRPPRSK